MERRKKNKNDHWAFLDEIEAPMWADLTLEPQYENGTDVEEWFHTNHLFHQCSSQKLKSAFSHLSDGSNTFNYDLQGPSSPKLPPSVSRSRGKDYKGKTCRLEHSKFSHQLGNQDKYKSHVQGGFNCKTKQKINMINPKALSSTLITGLTSKSRLSSRKPPNARNDSETSVCTSTTSTKTSETDRKSCISYENDLAKQQNSLNIPSQAFGNQSKLVQTIKMNLRKSVVARQASRMEIKGQREGYDSLSGSSSVGSSLDPDDLNLSKSMLSESKETTPDSGNVARLNHTDMHKKRSYNPSKGSIISTKEGKSRLARTAKTDGAIVAFYPSAKEKHHIAPEKSLKLHKVKERKPLMTVMKANETKKMIEISSQKKLVHAGKENAGVTTSSQTCSSKSSVDGAMGRLWKGKSIVMKGYADFLNNSSSFGSVSSHQPVIVTVTLEITKYSTCWSDDCSIFCLLLSSSLGVLGYIRHYLQSITGELRNFLSKT